MELQFQQPQNHHQQQCHYQEQVIKPVKSRGRRRSKSCGSSSKFVGVRQRPSGKWVAEIKDTTQKIRMWLGTFETAEEAARAYDEAACLLRGSNTRTNFATTTHSASTNSPLASRIRSLLDHKKLNKKNKNAPQPSAITFSPPAYHHASAATSCIAPNVNASISSDSSGTSFAMISNGIDTATASLSNQQFADEVYRPFLINGCEELDQSWAFDAGLPLAAEIAELDKMRMEKQVSAASIHGMNGIQDYFDMGHDPSDTLWDLPPICQLSCRSLMY